MKKYIFGSLLLSMSLLSACSLDETPESKFSEEEAFKSSKLIYVNTVANIYSSIGNGWYGGTDCIHTLQEFTSDATMLPGRGGDWVDGGKWQNLFLHNFESSVDLYATVWNHIYQIIGLCNKSIDKLEQFKATQPECEAFIYEVRALRACYYYNAMDLYAQVPVVTSSEMSISDVEQMNRADVFDFVTRELAECIPHLSEDKAQNTGEFYGRVTKAVAYMCMAKCALNAPVYTINNTTLTSYQCFVGSDLSKECTASETIGAKVNESGKQISITVDGKARNAWETVIYCADRLADLGYELEGNYADNFVVQNQNSKENIFVRPNDDKIYKIWDANLMRSLHYNHAGAIGYSGWNGACASTREMKVYGYGTADADPRLSLNFYIDKDYMELTGKEVSDGATDAALEYLPMAAVVDFAAGSDAHAVKCAGARFKKYEYDASSTIQGDNNNDLVIWRFGDAVLMKAEAEYRLGQTANALIDLNRIRDRAGAALLDALTLNDILNERMLELAWEGTRRQDQVRFGTFTQPTADRYIGVAHNPAAGDYNNDTKGYTNVYPIPYSVLNLNKNLHQNPGYNN